MHSWSSSQNTRRQWDSRTLLLSVLHIFILLPTQINLVRNTHCALLPPAGVEKFFLVQMQHVRVCWWLSPKLNFVINASLRYYYLYYYLWLQTQDYMLWLCPVVERFSFIQMQNILWSSFVITFGRNCRKSSAHLGWASVYDDGSVCHGS